MLHSRPIAIALGVLALVSLASCGASPAAEPQPAVPDEARLHLFRRAAVDAEHYSLDLELDPADQSLRGVCTVELVAAEDGLVAVDLDLVGLEVFAVRDGAGRRLRHAQRDGRLEVDLARLLARGERLTLAITYGGQPRGGLWYTALRDGLPTQVFTQGECEDARRWFPCFDDPADRATSELRVDMPASWISVAAGERIASSLEGARRIDHWRMSTPHPAYLTTLVAGELAVVDGDWRGLPLSFVAEERYRDWIPAAFSETDEALAFLEEVTGHRYPFPKYIQACVSGFPFGGMENVSATTLTDTTLCDEPGQRDAPSHGLVVHELAHQWFGDLLTCRDWSHVWLNEGFATYLTFLYFERTRGVDDFRIRLRDAQDAYTRGDAGEARRPIVWAVYKEPMDLFFGGHTYEGGATRLHLLRHELGDAAFFEGLRRYVADNAGRGVTTDDLRVAMEAAAGRDLSTFFEQWLLGPGYPEFDVSWSFAEDARELSLNIDQVQEPERGTPSVFHVSVDVEVRTPSGSALHRLAIDERRARFDLPCAEPPIWVRFDKHGAIPKVLRERRSDEEWMAIAAGDDDANGRRDALTALGPSIAAARVAEERERTLAVVVRRLREDPVPAVRIAAAQALGTAGGVEARFHLTVAATSDPVAAVRVATLEQLRSYGADPALADLAVRCFEAGYSWGVMIAAASLYASAEPDGAFEWIRARLGHESPHDRLSAGLVEVLGKLSHRDAAAELVRIARDPAVGALARAAAVAALGHAPKSDPALRALLAEALLAPELPVRRAAVSALVELGDPNSADDLEAGYAAALLPFERRAIEEALEALER